jgi:hypothetical protein
MRLASLVTELEAKKKAAAEAARRKEEEQKKLHPLRNGVKQVGVADWESVDDQYDATEDMGGEFDVGGAMKDGRKKLKKGQLKEALKHGLEQKLRQVETNLGDEGGSGRKKVSGWKSFIFGSSSSSSSRKNDKGKKGKKNLPDPNPNNTTPTLRRVQKDEAIKASGFKGKKGRGKGPAPDVPMAPSHIKPPSMPPPASALLTAAGAIAPLAPKGILPPKGPPPKAMKSTVEEKFIRAVWNMEDPPVAPSHIRPPGGGQEDNSWLTKMRQRYGKMSRYLRIKYEIIMSIGKVRVCEERSDELKSRVY